MKYYIIAGEASGDLHGSNLIKELKKKDQDANIRCWGGDLMQTEGATLVKHYRDLAFMGFVEVLLNLKTILKNIAFCKKDILEFKPDSIILIDYPGFNMRIAEFAKQQGIRVHYYISPQIWAWKQNRGFKLKRTVDKMFVILPFEKEFYKKFDMEVDYVGHPLIDAIENRLKSDSEKAELRRELNLSDKKIIALLPGSRLQEVSKMLPIMLKQAKHFPEYEFVLAAAPSLDDAIFADYLKDYQNFSVVRNRTYDLLQLSYAAMVTSGTATLETALFKVPEVVCYKGSFISYHIAKRIINIKYISLVNLIMDREVVKELIQGEMNEKLLRLELGKLLKDSEKRNEMLDNFNLLNNKLGGGGASAKTAELIIEDLKT
ncbi:MAG: lipid-A-disaccharide synthase [Bacteroidetes bacterium]|nr:MAG: lipid-A-disaccharide synthase [Bacteroidota bacterium]MBL1144535.1 lipid-A-disaccharide synthase [Bacteroidota bacterium]NOG57330.1 lipid-A-disaccharide synthase [Bacteroidota bacterium]